MRTIQELQDLFAQNQLNAAESDLEKKDFLCPCFQGFYDSVLYSGDMVSDIIGDELQQYRMDYPTISFEEDDLSFDDISYKISTCKSYAHAYCEYLSEFIDKGCYSRLDSPKQYNYRTDDLYLNITLKSGWKKNILSWMFQNIDFLLDRFAELYRYRDELRTFDYWVKGIEEEDVFVISMLLYLYIEKTIGKYAQIGNEDIATKCWEDIYENINYWEYIELSIEKQREIAKLY